MAHVLFTDLVVPLLPVDQQKNTWDNCGDRARVAAVSCSRAAGISSACPRATAALAFSGIRPRRHYALDNRGLKAART
jgi:hypothetical protein